MQTQFDFTVVDRIIDDHGAKQSATIAILQDIQEHYHYLPREIFNHLAKRLGMPSASIYSVATFYENFSLEPKGKYVIECCDGTACHVRGSMPILNRLREELKLAEGKKTTEDLLFTLDTVHCLGACGLAPVIMINENVYPTMTPDAAAKLISDLREKENENA